MAGVTDISRSGAVRSQFGDDRSTVALPVLYFALFVGDPEVGGVEPTSQGGYARVAQPNDSTLFGLIAAGAMSVSNVIDVSWPAATGLYDQSGLDHWAVFDNSTAGNLWYSGPLTAPVTISGSGDQIRIPIGDLVLTQGG